MKESLAAGLYGIADTMFGDPVQQGIQLANGGARVIQLRAKSWTTEARVRAGRALVEHLRPRGVRIVMNDDLRAALDARTDGLHLGQDDGDLLEARRMLGATALLGRSTHSLSQAIEAASQADYIGFGPVFATATKRAAGTARGLQQLEQVLLAVTIPVVAIGGIQPLMKTLLDAGLLHGDCLTVTGKTLAENLENVAPYPEEQDIIHGDDRTRRRR